LLRLTAGIAHLLAAGGWVGAIAVLLFLLVRHGRPATGAGLHTLWQILHAFARPGTVFVAILVVTGVLHYGDLVDWDVTPLFHTGHGNLMLLKLALFVAMLGLAALHRWRLVPRLERECQATPRPHAAQSLRRSMSIEAMIATLILASVAVLGTLNPQG